MGHTVLFDREFCVGGVVGARDVDINEACDGEVVGLFYWSRTEIMILMVFLG